MALAPYFLPGGGISGDDERSPSETASVATHQHNDASMESDKGTDEGVAELADRLKDVYIGTPQQANELHGAKLTVHANDIKQINKLYNKELESQFDAFRETREHHISELQSVKAETEGLKATLDEYAKENQSLKEKIQDQQSEIKALKDENWLLNLKMSSVLYTLGPLENQVQRLTDQLRNLDKSTK